MSKPVQIPLSEITGQPYYSLRMEDVPEWWVIGASCMACGRVEAISRRAVQRRWRGLLLPHVAQKLRCSGCGNRDHNTFVALRKEAR